MLSLDIDGAVIPRSVSGYRIRFRRESVSKRYSGWLHFAFTSSVCSGLIAYALSSLDRVAAWELAAIPATFVFGNGVEYVLHRFPMHRRLRPVGIMYSRHTLLHHRYFTARAMSYETSSDIKAILFPPVMVVVLAALIAPVWLLLRSFASPDAAWLFYATALGYFLSYEWLHFAHHLPQNSLVARLPGMPALRRHHTAHHETRLMSRCNFNVTFPIFDYVFGTRHRPE